MERDPTFVYGPHGHAVDLIIKQAARMSLGQLATTAQAVNSEIGTFGRKKDWHQAESGLVGVANSHARSEFVTAAKDDAMDAVITAVQRIVMSSQKSDAAIAQRWMEYRSALLDANRRGRTRAFRRLQRSLISGLGLRVGKSVALASGAASSAAETAVVWDLAKEGGIFAPPERELLMGPWTTEFSLPPGLSS